MNPKYLIKGGEIVELLGQATENLERAVQEHYGEEQEEENQVPPLWKRN